MYQTVSCLEYGELESGVVFFQHMGHVLIVCDGDHHDNAHVGGDGWRWSF